MTPYALRFRWRPRWFAEWYAHAFGYFWLPCPICGEPFGGQEWATRTDILKTTDPSRGEGHCPKQSCRERAKTWPPIPYKPPRAPSPKIELARGEIASVSLKPGDRLVIMYDLTLSREYVERLRVQMEQWAPGIPCAVLDGGARLGVIRQELMPDCAAGDSKG